jgi:hypothetical protein
MTLVAPSTPPPPFPSKLNRRRYTRVSTRQMRSCFLAHGIGPANGWVVDISLGGVFLRTSWPLPVGEQLAIELPRGGQASPVCVRGRVVSSSMSGTAPRSGMGVRFDALDPMTLTQLRELLRNLAPIGTKLELQPEDNEITAVAPIPNGLAPRITAPVPPPPARKLTPTPLPKLTAAQPTPIAAVAPSAPRPLVRDLADALENERLRNHARGLLMQVADLQMVVSQRDREIAALREAVAHLQASNAHQLRNPR